MVEVPDPRSADADKVRSIQVETMRFRKVLFSLCPGGMVPIVMISESGLDPFQWTPDKVESIRVRYAFMAEHQGQFHLKRLCRVFRVHRNGDYAWKATPNSMQAKAD
jgi:hypothetical protein